MQRVVCEVRALAVLPTKELAQQVGTLTKNKSIMLTNLIICILKSSLKVFSCSGVQGFLHVCRGNLSESSDAGGSEESLCRTSFPL